MSKAGTATRKSGTAYFKPNPMHVSLRPDLAYNIEYLDNRVRLAWEATKSSFFYQKLKFPDNETRRIDQIVSSGVISASAAKQSLSGPRVPIVPKLQGLISSRLRAFLVLQLSLVPLGCPIELAVYQVRKIQSGLNGNDIAIWYVLRDVVAIANGIEATSEYSRDWLEPSPPPPVAITMKRKASVDADEAQKKTKTRSTDADTKLDTLTHLARDSKVRARPELAMTQAARIRKNLVRWMPR